MWFYALEAKSNYLKVIRSPVPSNQFQVWSPIRRSLHLLIAHRSISSPLPVTPNSQQYQSFNKGLMLFQLGWGTWLQLSSVLQSTHLSIFSVKPCSCYSCEKLVSILLQHDRLLDVVPREPDVHQPPAEHLVDQLLRRRVSLSAVTATSHRKVSDLMSCGRGTDRKKPRIGGVRFLK